jgi:hypothetical protein
MVHRPQREEGVAYEDIKLNEASGDDAGYDILRVQERDRPLDAQAVAQRVGNWQVRGTRHEMRTAAERALQCASYYHRELDPGRPPILRAEQSDLVVKAIEGVCRADFAEMVHELPIKDLSDPEMIATWVRV